MVLDGRSNVDNSVPAVTTVDIKVPNDSDVINNGSDGKTYNRYKAIQNANSASYRDEELRRMKEAYM